jgi:hypothetical protein
MNIEDRGIRREADVMMGYWRWALLPEIVAKLF